MALKRDSVQKILSYLESASKEVQLSPLFFRDYSCPAGCGGCCPTFSLDYVKGSERWESFKKRYPEHLSNFQEREVNGVIFMTDFQKDNDSKKCRHLRWEDGRCKIHEHNPLTCEFELMKLTKKGDNTLLINKLFGRGWSYTRTDGGVGALCEMLFYKKEKTVRDVEMLEELDDIGKRMKIKTKLSRIIEFIKKRDYLPINKKITFK